MTNKSITITGKRITNWENFLVNAFVFYTFWSFFTGFPIAFNGFFRMVLGGKLDLILTFVIFFVSAFSLATSPKSFSSLNLKYAISFVAALLFIWVCMIISISEVDNGLITPLLSVPFFILMRDDLKLLCLDRFVKILSIILIFALVEYFVFLIFNKGIILFSGIGRVGFEDLRLYVFDQYLLNIFYTGQMFPRFQCLCEEPGCIGTICGFLIYALKGRKEFRYQYFVFIIAGAFSFSLAFFALFALHFFLNVKHQSQALMVVLVLFIVVYYVFSEAFNDLLFYRLQGGFQNADNRVTEDFGSVFLKARSEGDLWLPHGSEKGSFGAGVKMWIWRYGIISFIIVFISYYYCYWQKVKTYKVSFWPCIVFFIAFWMSFYQRHWIFNIDYIIIYISIPIFYAYQTNNKNA